MTDYKIKCAITRTLTNLGLLDYLDAVVVRINLNLELDREELHELIGTCDDREEEKKEKRSKS